MADNVLGKNVNALLTQQSVSLHELHMQRIKNAKSHTNSIARHAAVKKFHQPSPSRAAAISRVMKTPVTTR